MKAIRAILTGIFKSFNYKAFSIGEVKKEVEPVFMTLEEAKQNHGIVSEMYKQLNNAKLTIGSSNEYVAGVEYKNNQYYILGRYEDWELFFGMRS